MVGDAVLGIVVGADFFGAVAGFDLATALGADGGLLFFEFHLVEAGTKDAHGFCTIFDLGFFILLRDDEPRRQVGDAHSRVRGVDGLTAGAGRAESVDAQILGFDFDVDFVGFGKDGDGGGGGVDAALGFGGGDALNSVDAAFVFQLGINFLALDCGDDFFYPTHLSWGAFHDFHFPALGFSVARVHAEEVAGKNASFVAAGAGADFEDDIFVVNGIVGKEKKF